MRIVIALGGNALLPRGDQMDAGTQRADARRACDPSATVVPAERGGGGARKRPAGRPARPAAGRIPTAEPYPLDVLGAETEAMIGYLIEQELGNLPPSNSPIQLCWWRARW